MTEFCKLSPISLRDHPGVSEEMVQKYIADNPEVLGLGSDVVVREKERRQPMGGRLDLLLGHEKAKKRYAVEIQLGSTNPDHIMRAIEYWDWERKHYPNYEHCAVLIAEEITSRFFNVISLFNGQMPLIAVQLAAFKMEGEKIGLLFIKVLDEIKHGDGDADETAPPADENYWVKAVGDKPVNLVKYAFDKIACIHSKEWELNYVRNYIGLRYNRQVKNVLAFDLYKGFVRLHFSLPEIAEVPPEVEDIGIYDGYDPGWGSYKFRININCEQEIDKHAKILREFFRRAAERRGVTYTDPEATDDAAD